MQVNNEIVGLVSVDVRGVGVGGKTVGTEWIGDVHGIVVTWIGFIERQF